MKKALPIVIMILIVAAVIIVVTGKNKAGNNQMGNMKSPSPGSSSTSPQAINTVAVSNFSFNPSSIIVKKGTTVTWTNHDSVVHTIQETDGKDGPKSTNINNGQSYSFTYNTPGTFAYHCSLHPGMTGTVTVTD